MPGLNPRVASSPPIRNRAPRRRTLPTPTPGSRRASRHRATFSYSQRHTGHRERARGAQAVPGMPQGWFQSTPGTPSYRQRHAPKPAIHAYGMPAAMSGAWGADRIPASDSRNGPRKQAIRQTDAIRTHPKTAESCGSRNKTGQPPNRPQPRSRTKSNLDGQSPNQSKTAAPATDNRRPYTAGNSGIPWFVDDDRPVAQPGTH